MIDFEYVTLNTNGVLKDVNAKTSIFNSNRGKILFLQEVHTTEASRKDWEKHGNRGDVFVSLMAQAVVQVSQL